MYDKDIDRTRLEKQREISMICLGVLLLVSLIIFDVKHPSSRYVAFGGTYFCENNVNMKQELERRARYSISSIYYYMNVVK